MLTNPSYKACELARNAVTLFLGTHILTSANLLLNCCCYGYTAVWNVRTTDKMTRPQFSARASRYFERNFYLFSPKLTAFGSQKKSLISAFTGWRQLEKQQRHDNDKARLKCAKTKGKSIRSIVEKNPLHIAL